MRINQKVRMLTSFIPPLEALPARKSPLMERFAALLEPKGPAQIEAMARESQIITRRNFGKTMRLFAPLYVSNECVNNCSYCGFSRDNNAILRVTLTVEQVMAEAKHLVAQGFRNILLVAGEHPRFVSDGYLEECIRALRDFVPTIGIEVGPMEAPEYERMVKAGAEGLVVYQETYDRVVYEQMHTAGPKKDFDWRLACPERGYEGGFRRIGIGALFGLSDWRLEALRLAAHLEHLYKHCWKSTFTVAFPRLRPAAGGFTPMTDFPDWALVQTICAFRLTFPEVGVVLSTREPAPLRDALAPLGVTMMSAGSHTEPGGYTGAGKERIHKTERGRIVELGASEWAGCEPTATTSATSQFKIADERTAPEVAEVIRKLGCEPVWKDWDAAILA